MPSMLTCMQTSKGHVEALRLRLATFEAQKEMICAKAQLPEGCQNLASKLLHLSFSWATTTSVYTTLDDFMCWERFGLTFHLAYCNFLHHIAELFVC